VRAKNQGSLPADVVAKCDEVHGRRRGRILIAEDDADFRELMAVGLQADGHETVAVSNGIDLLKALAQDRASDSQTEAFDLVISDVRMPGCSGIDAVAKLGHGPGVPPVLLISAFADDELCARAHEIGVLDILDKPFDVDDLRLFVNQCLAKRRL